MTCPKPPDGYRLHRVTFDATETLIEPPLSVNSTTTLVALPRRISVTDPRWLAAREKRKRRGRP